MKLLPSSLFPFETTFVRLSRHNSWPSDVEFEAILGKGLIAPRQHSLLTFLQTELWTIDGPAYVLVLAG